MRTFSPAGNSRWGLPHGPALMLARERDVTSSPPRAGRVATTARCAYRQKGH
nr:MAG TPA: hypothetical protein [Caudoviricetes sp.]